MPMPTSSAESELRMSEWETFAFEFDLKKSDLDGLQFDQGYFLPRNFVTLAKSGLAVEWEVSCHPKGVKAMLTGRENRNFFLGIRRTGPPGLFKSELGLTFRFIFQTKSDGGAWPAWSFDDESSVALHENFTWCQSLPKPNGTVIHYRCFVQLRGEKSAPYEPKEMVKRLIAEGEKTVVGAGPLAQTLWDAIPSGCDVVFKLAEGKEVKTHSCILTSQNKYFAGLEEFKELQEGKALKGTVTIDWHPETSAASRLILQQIYLWTPADIDWDDIGGFPGLYSYLSLLDQVSHREMTLFSQPRLCDRSTLRTPTRADGGWSCCCWRSWRRARISRCSWGSFRWRTLTSFPSSATSPSPRDP